MGNSCCWISTWRILKKRTLANGQNSALQLLGLGSDSGHAQLASRNQMGKGGHYSPPPIPSWLAGWPFAKSQPRFAAIPLGIIRQFPGLSDLSSFETIRVKWRCRSCSRTKWPLPLGWDRLGSFSPVSPAQLSKTPATKLQPTACDTFLKSKAFCSGKLQTPMNSLQLQTIDFCWMLLLCYCKRI